MLTFIIVHDGYLISSSHCGNRKGMVLLTTKEITNAIPPLGCGLGGLCWSDVRAKIEEAFQGLNDVQVLLYEPKDAKFA